MQADSRARTPLCSPLFLQLRKREFEVLAGPQFAGGVVGARTEITARPQASNRDAIAGFRCGIADPKLGEKRFVRQIFKPERLLAAELTAQTALPVHRRQIGRSMGAGKLGFLDRLGNEIRFSARGFHQDTFRTESFNNPASVPVFVAAMRITTAPEPAESRLPHSHSIIQNDGSTLICNDKSATSTVKCR